MCNAKCEQKIICKKLTLQPYHHVKLTLILIPPLAPIVSYK